MVPASPTSPIRAVGIVVPVHNEEELLERCVSSIERAVAIARSFPGPQPRIGCVLVLDDCSDGSDDIAAASGFQVLRTKTRNVGVARSTGVLAVMDLFADVPLTQLWIANTDADSAVPQNWLSHGLDLADNGADIVIGTVYPDPSDLDPVRRRAWEATHTIGRPNGHVHGANLGVRASVYAAAGGFGVAPEHEDVNLVEAARLLTDRVRATDAASVLTSGRLRGRTAGGYARYLRDDLLELSQVREPTQPRQDHAPVESQSVNPLEETFTTADTLP